VRAVLDANVLVSALLSPRGTPAALVRGWLKGEFELVVSERLLGELRRSLRYPKPERIPSDAADEFVALLRDGALTAADPVEPPRRSSDLGDDYLLALAEAERAVLVSGDRHLLELAGTFPVRSSREFLRELRES
jgi:uncharacterized protein